MELSQAAAHFGLSAFATATRHGIDWRPRVGPAADRVLFPDAEIAATWDITFADPAALFNLEPNDDFTVTLAGGIEEISVSGITGTGAGSLNGTYTRDIALSNGLPAWTNGSATIRYNGQGYYVIALSGVAQFITAAPSFSPIAFYAIAVGGSATGTASLAPSFDGAAPVHNGGDQVDFEGVAVTSAELHGVLVHCTAGVVVVSLGIGTNFVLSAGQHVQLALPGGQVADFLVSGSGVSAIAVISAAAGSAATLALLAAVAA